MFHSLLHHSGGHPTLSMGKLMLSWSSDPLPDSMLHAEKLVMGLHGDEARVLTQYSSNLMAFMVVFYDIEISDGICE